MSALGFSLLVPLGLIGLVGIPLVVIFHMRHTSPRDVNVPTLRFWHMVAEQQNERVRLHRPPLSLLLLLQVLAVALLAFGLTRPATSRALGILQIRTEPQHMIILLDGSTSMDATDTTSGASAWTEARQRTVAKLDGLHEGDAATVVVLATQPMTLEATDTASLAQLRSRVGSLPLPGGRADLNAAFRLTKDLLLNGLDNRVVVISDGALTVDPQLVSNLGAPVTYERVGGVGQGLAATNVAVTTIGTGADPSNPNQQEIFARVENFSGSPVTAPVTLTADSINQSRQTVNIPAGGASELSWPLPNGAKNVSVTIGVHDALAADNTASLVLQQSAEQGLNILLISDAPTYLQRALSVLPGAHLTVAGTSSPQAAAPGGPYDLVVYDSFVPIQQNMPPAPMLFVHPTDAGPFQTTGVMSDPALASMRAQDPLLNGVDLSGVTFGPTPVYTLASGSTTVVGAQQGPLIFRGIVNNQPYIALAFDVTQSNLPQRPAFPILITNIANNLAPSPLPSAVPLGDPLQFRPHAGASTVRITPPNSDPVKLSLATGTSSGDAASADTEGLLRQVSFADTGRPGSYKVDELNRAGQQLTAGSFVVNAGHPAESNLAPNPDLPKILAAAHGSGKQVTRATLADLWPLLVAATFGLLVLEWLFSMMPPLHRRRRPGGAVTATGPGD